MNEIWKLTDEEIARADRRGVSVGALQEAKRDAYIANGGVIPSPDALEDLYKVLKRAFTDPQYVLSGEWYQPAKEALAKAQKT